MQIHRQYSLKDILYKLHCHLHQDNNHQYKQYSLMQDHWFQLKYLSTHIQEVQIFLQDHNHKINSKFHLNRWHKDIHKLYIQYQLNNVLCDKQYILFHYYRLNNRWYKLHIYLRFIRSKHSILHLWDQFLHLYLHHQSFFSKFLNIQFCNILQHKSNNLQLKYYILNKESHITYIHNRKIQYYNNLLYINIKEVLPFQHLSDRCNRKFHSNNFHKDINRLNKLFHHGNIQCNRFNKHQEKYRYYKQQDNVHKEYLKYNIHQYKLNILSEKVQYKFYRVKYI